MKKLDFEQIIDYPLAKTWFLFTDVDNFPHFLKYCYKARIEGEFKVGGYWYDWTTLVYLPLKVRHQITKIALEKELVYLIKNPLMSIEQTIKLSDLEKQTKVDIGYKINFRNRLVEIVLGPLICRRNSEEIRYLMNNYKKVKIHETN